MSVRIEAQISRPHPHRDTPVQCDLDARRPSIRSCFHIAHTSDPAASRPRDGNLPKLLAWFCDQIERLQTAFVIAIFDRRRIAPGLLRDIIIADVLCIALPFVLIVLLLASVALHLLLILLLLYVVLGLGTGRRTGRITNGRILLRRRTAILSFAGGGRALLIGTRLVG